MFAILTWAENVTLNGLAVEMKHLSGCTDIVFEKCAVLDFWPSILRQVAASRGRPTAVRHAHSVVNNDGRSVPMYWRLSTVFVRPKLITLAMVDMR